MRKVQWELICQGCGKKFILESSDAIYPQTQAILKNPLCPKCRLKRRVCMIFGFQKS